MQESISVVSLYTRPLSVLIADSLIPYLPAISKPDCAEVLWLPDLPAACVYYNMVANAACLGFGALSPKPSEVWGFRLLGLGMQSPLGGVRERKL